MVSAVAVVDKSIVWLYVDFRKATEQDAARAFIYSRILELIEADKQFNLGSWADTINPAYASEIENLARGPLFLLKQADSPAFDKEVAAMILKERAGVVPYVDRILRYVSQTKPLFVVIDNVDQIEDDRRQGEIFAEAQALSQKHKISFLR